MENKIIAVCIIKNSKGELLLQKKTLDYPNYPGAWCLLGGHAESEDLEKEMKRELEEEIGLTPQIKLLFNQEVSAGNKKFRAYIFLANIDNIFKIKIGEGAGLAFFGKEELKDLKLIPDSKKILERYFKEIKMDYKKA